LLTKCVIESAKRRVRKTPEARVERGLEPANRANGPSLREIHHAAYDNEILSVDPDHVVQCRSQRRSAEPRLQWAVPRNRPATAGPLMSFGPLAEENP